MSMGNLGKREPLARQDLSVVKVNRLLGVGGELQVEESLRVKDKEK